MDWDDLRAFLAVAQRGSLRQAADALGVTQPTIARRLKSLESQLGLPLFDRTRDGHQLTEAGTLLLPEVRAVETAALRVEQRALGLVDGLQETVRVQGGEWVAGVLARGLHKVPGETKIELVLSGAPMPDTDRSPDISLHHGLPDSGHGLTRRVGAIEVALYGAPALLGIRTAPLPDADLAALPWLSFIEEQQHYVTMRWMQDFMDGKAPSARMMNSDLMLTAAQNGVGVAILPCFMGDAAPGLVRLSNKLSELRAEYWIKVNSDLAQNQSIRLVSIWITECFRDIEAPQGP